MDLIGNYDGSVDFEDTTTSEGFENPNLSTEFEGFGSSEGRHSLSDGGEG